MKKKLGKIDKPRAEHFKEAKKLYLVPLVYCIEDAPDEYKEKSSRYWEQVAEQLINLETKIGRVNRVYHESISLSGEDGLKFVEKLNSSSYQIAKSKCANGAVFEAVEENDVLQEAMDWERCLLIGFVSDKVASKISEFYVEASRKRYEFIAKRLDETLKSNEAGLLFIGEGHRLQFPEDVEVFSVFPPALDEIHRWLRDQTTREQEKAKE